jgi:hypothetical protein
MNALHKLVKSKFYLPAILLFAACGISFAQNPELKKLIKQANEYYERADYLNAYTIYKQVEMRDPSLNSTYKSGVCLFSMNNHDSLTLDYFFRASSKVPESHYYIGRIYLLNNNIYDAMTEFLFFKTKYSEDFEVTPEETERWIAICKRSIEQLLNKKDYSIRNMGAGINSRFPDYAPVLSNDENTLVFTSRREGSTGGKKDPYGNYFEDIYYSSKTDSGWSKALQFGNNINTDTHDASVTFTPDSNALILYRTDAKQTGGDLYISRQDGKEWQQPKLLNKKINSDFLESSACYSLDGDVIIFSSNRPGGFGGRDLYKIRKFSDELYSLPQNLGPLINTPYDEDAPFLSSDGKMLYFSSNGRNTIGGYDIFEAEYDANNGKCGSVTNMGEPLNSTSDDIFFILKKDGQTGYFSSNRPGGFGNMDIYEVGLDESKQLFTVIKGQLNSIDNQTLNLKKIQIILTESSGKIKGIYKLKHDNNTFILVVDKRLDYKITIESPEIEPFSKSIKFDSDEISLTVKKKQE